MSEHINSSVDVGVDEEMLFLDELDKASEWFDRRVRKLAGDRIVDEQRILDELEGDEPGFVNVTLQANRQFTQDMLQIKADVAANDSYELGNKDIYDLAWTDAMHTLRAAIDACASSGFELAEFQDSAIAVCKKLEDNAMLWVEYSSKQPGALKRQTALVYQFDDETMNVCHAVEDQLMVCYGLDIQEFNAKVRRALNDVNAMLD